MGQDTSTPCSKGFRVLGIQKGSPGAKAGLISFFDFILGVNDLRLKRDDSTFSVTFFLLSFLSIIERIISSFYN